MLRPTQGNTLLPLLQSFLWPVLDSDTGLGSEHPPSLQLRHLYLVMPFLSTLLPLDPTDSAALGWSLRLSVCRCSQGCRHKRS